jgi:hypothetical protein
MATSTLVEFPREAGWKLLEAADKEGLEITDAFWIFLPEEETWRLVLAAPATQTEGGIAVTRRILALLESIPEDEREGLSLSDIAIVSPHLLLVDNLRASYGTITEGRGQRVRRAHLSRSEPFIYRLQ